MEAEPFYDDNAPQEWKRLERHRTEFAVSLKVITGFLPALPSRVLDAGGGPGRYSIALSEIGHNVTILDLSSASLDLAVQNAEKAGAPLAGAVHANVLDMHEIGDDGFDAVLLMGPLYHLLSEQERVQAIREAMRVLVPGGFLFAAFITRFAPFRQAAVNEQMWLVENAEYAQRMLETGLHEKPTQFAQAFFIHPDDVVPLMESCGLLTLSLVGCEGIVAGHEEGVNALEGEAWDAWVELNFKLGQEPTLYGASDHLLYAGKNPV